jgi:hypothetical protein
VRPSDKREEKTHEEFYNVVCMPDTVRLIKSRRLSERGRACSTHGGDEKF